MKKGFLHSLGKSILPEKLRIGLKKYLLKRGIYESPYSLYGGVFALTIIITVLVYALLFLKGARAGSVVFFALGSFFTLCAA